MIDDFLLRAVICLAWIILVPTILICLAAWVVSKVCRISFYVHALFGIVGVPIHEIAHAAACFIFRMPVTGVRLYSPNPVTGNLGYVSFAYNPRSGLHAIGLLVQGVAPLLLASMIFRMLIPISDLEGFSLSGQGAGWFELHVLEGINLGLALTLGNLASGAAGGGWAVLVLLIGAYAIPSWADVRLALRGTLVLAFILVGICSILTVAIDLTPLSMRGVMSNTLGLLADLVSDCLSFGVSSVALVSFIGLIGGLAIQLLPALVYFLFVQLLNSIRGRARIRKDTKSRPEGPAVS